MQPTHGHCEKECRTIERACDDVLDKADTDFTEIRCVTVAPARLALALTSVARPPDARPR